MMSMQPWQHVQALARHYVHLKTKCQRGAVSLVHARIINMIVLQGLLTRTIMSVMSTWEQSLKHRFWPRMHAINVEGVKTTQV